MASTALERFSLAELASQWRAMRARLGGLGARAGWLRDLPVEATSRYGFVLAMVASMAVGTAALVSALMGSATEVTPGVVRATYVGVVLMAVVACAALLVIEAGIGGIGPLAGVASEADRDALHATSLSLAAAILFAARLSLPVGGIVAAGAAGALVGQVAFVAGGRDLRRLASVAVVAAVAALAYLGHLLIGAEEACPDCTRGPWILALAGVGLVTGLTVGWAARRVPVAVDRRRLVGVGAALFVMAATLFLVRDPVRASFTVLVIVGLAVPTAIPRHVLDRSRDLAIDAGCLALAGLEVLVGPPGTVPLGIVAVLARAATRVPSGWPRAVVAAVVGVIGVALSVNVVPPLEESHHGFFLFPMRDIAAGRSLLVDVNAQYGVGLVYALALLAGGTVDGITLTVLSVWTNVANVVLYVTLWAGCAWLLRDWAIGSVFWLAVVVNRSVSIGIAEAYPSTGAWRFGLPWLLVADAVAARNRLAPWRRLLRVGYWIVASTWSLEVALYSAVLLAIDLVIDAVRGWRYRDVPSAGRRIASRVAEAVAGTLIGMAFLAGATWWRAGQWPDARHYLEYFGTYGAGFGFHQPVPWAAWSPMFLGCAAAMVALGVRAALAKPGDPMRREARVVALVGAYGVLQFTYYAFRPHSNNLLHVMFPPAILAMWLLAQSWRPAGVHDGPDAVGDARAVVRATVLAGVALVGAVGLTAAVPRVPGTLVGQAIHLWRTGNLLVGPWFAASPPEPVGERAALRSLLARRYPGVPTVPMLLADDLWMHAIIGTPYLNRLPLSFEQQDGLIPIGVSAAITAARKMPFGTDLVVEAEFSRLNGLRRDVAMEICGRGLLVPEERSSRVVSVRFVARENRDHPDVCQAWGIAVVP